MKSKYSHKLLQNFFEKELPDSKKIEDGLLLHSFEVENVFKLKDDVVYELDILPNRSKDCLSHYGIAKELSVIFDIPLSKKYFKKELNFQNKKEYIKTSMCKRYSILEFKNFKCDETPHDIKMYLESIGQQCINPIVDLSNYVMFLIGQPIHVFDKNKINGDFSVRLSKEGEKIILLGGDVIELKEDIVITDNDKPVALAGIKGGDDTKVSVQSKDIYIEIASFDPVSIRKTMRRLNILSNSALRFSQGIPPEFIGYSADVIKEIFSEYAEFVESNDSYTGKLKNTIKTGVSIHNVNNLLGTTYTEEDIKNVFNRFGFEYEYIDPREKFVDIVKKQLGKPYTFGASVSLDAPNTFDCSSLICFAAAQAGLSIPRMAINIFLYSKETSDIKPGDICFFDSNDKDLPFKYKRIYEAGFPTIPGESKHGVNHCGVYIGDNKIIVAEGTSGANKVIELDIPDKCLARKIFDEEKRFVVEIPIERTDLQKDNDLIEEIGRILGYDNIENVVPKNESKKEVNQVLGNKLFITKKLNEIGFSEVFTYSFKNKGDVCVTYPVAKDKGCLRTNLSHAMKDVLSVNSYNGELLEIDEVKIFEIGNVFTKDGEKTNIVLGVTNVSGRKKIDVSNIEKEVSEILGINCRFENQIFETCFDDVLNNVSEYEKFDIKDMKYEESSRFPFVLRDISMYTPSGVDFSEVRENILKNSGENIKRVNLFDSFLVDGKQSFAFRLIFQSNNKTLNNEDVTHDINNLTEYLTKNGYTIR